MNLWFGQYYQFKKKIFINYIIINEIHKNEVFPKFRVLGHQLIRLYLKPHLSDT